MKNWGTSICPKIKTSYFFFASNVYRGGGGLIEKGQGSDLGERLFEGGGRLFKEIRYIYK